MANEDLTRRAFRSTGVVLTALALAAGAGACGSDDDGGDAGDGGTQAAEAGYAEIAATGGDRAQVRALLRKLQEDYVAGRAEAYCDGLTPGGRDLAARTGIALSMGDTCETFIATASRRTRQAGIRQRPTVVLRVRVDGDRAVATVSDGGRPPQPMRFVKQDGEWKLPDPGFRQGLEATNTRLPSRS